MKETRTEKCQFLLGKVQRGKKNVKKKHFPVTCVNSSQVRYNKQLKQEAEKNGVLITFTCQFLLGKVQREAVRQ